MAALKTTLFLGLLLFWCGGAGAHPSPEHDAETLRQLRWQGKATAAEMMREAAAWHELGELDTEAQVLRELIARHGDETARARLAANLLAAGNTNAASIVLAGAPATEPFSELRLRLAMDRQQWTDAARFGILACQSPDAPDDWYLETDTALAALGRHRQREMLLAARLARGPSAALADAHIDAMIAAGDIAKAVPIIDEALLHCRFRATWLIRRARVHAIAGRSSEADADLAAALNEINQRLAVANDPYLLLDRAYIHALQQNSAGAAADLAAAALPISAKKMLILTIVGEKKSSSPD